MKSLRLYATIIVLLITPMMASAGALSIENVIKRLSLYPKPAHELLLILSERNLSDEYCDIKYYSTQISGSSNFELLCNTSQNSVVAIKNYTSESPVVEHRLDEQANVGINPID